MIKFKISLLNFIILIFLFFLLIFSKSILYIYLNLIYYFMCLLKELEALIFFDFNNSLNYKIDSNISKYLYLFKSYELENYLLFTNFFKIFLNYPIFILFLFLFLFTTIFSLISISYLGLYGVYILNLSSLLFLWIAIIPYIFNIFNKNIFYFISLGKWMFLNSNFKISFDILIDNISLSFAFLTLTIALFVYIYTFSYFRYEPLVERLILFLNSFIISMVFLVFSGNFITMFLGWEMIGLTSFFLINFWSTRVGTLKAAFKAYSFNKTSDLFLFFAIIIIFNFSLNLDILIFNQTLILYKKFYINFFFFEFPLLDFISLFFLGSAFIKSAQFGAHIWLPDSMEAPVPASALIHSATLVSAGIYLLLRLNNLFELAESAIYIIAIISSITAFYGGIVSMFQSDTKRILAYSTISHCGFLMVIYTTGVLEYVILYLYIHGFFKAASFLTVGNIIRYSRNIQDFKRMGGYYKFLPFDCLAAFICLINLGGLPLTYGFYIKHALFVGLNNNTYIYYFVLLNSFLGALTGLFYSSKLFYYVFFDFKKNKKIIYLSSFKKNLNSKFYTNSTIAANLSITFLILFSYIFSLYFFYTYLNLINYQSDIYKEFLYSNYFSFYFDSINVLLNFSFINWVVLFLILCIIFTFWRNIIFIENIYNFFFLLLFLSWFIVFIK